MPASVAPLPSERAPPSLAAAAELTSRPETPEVVRVAPSLSPLGRQVRVDVHRRLRPRVLGVRVLGGVGVTVPLVFVGDLYLAVTWVLAVTWMFVCGLYCFADLGSGGGISFRAGGTTDSHATGGGVVVGLSGVAGGVVPAGGCCSGAGVGVAGAAGSVVVGVGG